MNFWKLFGLKVCSVEDINALLETTGHESFSDLINKASKQHDTLLKNAGDLEENYNQIKSVATDALNAAIFAARTKYGQDMTVAEEKLTKALDQKEKAATIKKILVKFPAAEE